MSVTPAEAHPYWMKRIHDDGRMTDFIKLDQPMERRQDLPPLYVLNGALLLGSLRNIDGTGNI